ncbi:unnamed protein product [Cuscuta campestris]|uniref:Uncharacterized protein n=2 Tax=Cuscuta sect. Cleistogrammica TaxID=1824901 RepID=A0A484K9G1_9ASTE|nr:hypothetical protein DM860_008514 [Cuscuta australis]VFQ58446.1 unnamed protein product [Cuscuta campestris]
MEEEKSGENNGATTRHRRRYLAREFGSRFRSPILSTRRSLSPNVRQATADEETVSSADRTQPSPEAMRNHSLGDGLLLVKREGNQHTLKKIDSLKSKVLDPQRWPSTAANEPTQESSRMLPFGKDEKEEIGSRSVEENSLKIRKGSRPASPTRGNMQSLPISESSRSLSSLHSELLDRWPGRTCGKVSSDSSNSGAGGKIDRSSGTSLRARALSLDELSKPLQKSPTQGVGENSTSIDSLHSQWLNQSRWPSTTGEKTSSNPMNKDAESGKSNIRPTSPLQRLSSDGDAKMVHKLSREMQPFSPSPEGKKAGFGSHPIVSQPSRREITSFVNPGSRSRPTSPKRAPTLPSTFPIRVIPSDLKAISSDTSFSMALSQRLSLDGAIKPLQSSSGDMLPLITSNEHTGGGLGVSLVNSNTLTPERKITPFLTPNTRSHPTSPEKATELSSSVSEAVSPSSKKVMASDRSIFIGSKTPPLQRMSLESEKGMFRFHSVDDNYLSLQRERTTLVNCGTRSRPASPNKASSPYFSASRAIPSQSKAIASASSRGVSPSKVRPSSPSRPPNPAIIFLGDIQEKDENLTEDAHQLRLLQNRYLQWRYANAKADAAIHAENVDTQENAYNMWNAISCLWRTVTEMRTKIQQLKLQLKLHSILNEQMSYLEKWATIERNYIRSVLRASRDMKSCVLLLPMTGGAKTDIQSLKSAVSSAFVMGQYVESSIYLMLSQLEGTSFLASELAGIVAQERALLEEFELLMAPIAEMQVEECSLRTYLMQLGTNMQKR